MDIEEQATIREAQRGNMLAFESLVKRYDRKVWQLAYSMVNHSEDAEDIYQEVFVRVYKNLAKFQFRSEFSTWLYRVVVNYCLNYQKRTKKQRTYSLQKEAPGTGENWQTSLKGHEKDPEARLLNCELSSEIEHAIRQLSEKQKLVFELRHFHGHKLKEIAAIMSCSEGTVKNYLFRATRKMQRLLHSHATN